MDTLQEERWDTTSWKRQRLHCIDDHWHNIICSNRCDFIFYQTLVVNVYKIALKFRIYFLVGARQRRLSVSVKPGPSMFNFSIPAIATIVAPSKPARATDRAAFGT